MAKFKVTVAVSYLKELTIFAGDEDEAKEKAEDIVSAWNNVHAVETQEVEQE